MWDRLDALKGKGLTVVMTTHYMEEAQNLCDRLVIVDHGKILVEGSPRGLIDEHTGGNVIEISGHEETVIDFVREHDIEYDDLGDRLILYTPTDASDLNNTIIDRFCVDKCTYRNSTLEDVFLRLTGRELRE
jgi:lipooligosaccharide transport system ATP-binding protein